MSFAAQLSQLKLFSLETVTCNLQNVKSRLNYWNKPWGHDISGNYGHVLMMMNELRFTVIDFLPSEKNVRNDFCYTPNNT